MTNNIREEESSFDEAARRPTETGKLLLTAYALVVIWSNGPCSLDLKNTVEASRLPVAADGVLVGVVLFPFSQIFRFRSEIYSLTLVSSLYFISLQTH